MALVRDTTLVSEYAKLKRDRYEAAREIQRTPFSQQDKLPQLIARVEAIEQRMREMRAQSLIRLE